MFQMVGIWDIGARRHVLLGAVVDIVSHDEGIKAVNKEGVRRI